MNSHQLAEELVVDPDDVPLVLEVRVLLVLQELHLRQPRTGQGQVNGVAPHLSLVGNGGLGILL